MAHIMVVDDDPNVREVLLLTLRAMGHRVITEEEGSAALERIAQNRFDLIILDVMMPEMDGWELLKIIKDDPKMENIKVLLLTAKDTDKDKMIGRDILKANGYMTKPFELNEIVKVVRGLLDGSSS